MFFTMTFSLHPHAPLPLCMVLAVAQQEGGVTKEAYAALALQFFGGC